MNKISPCGTYCKVAKGDDVLHGFKTWTQEILRKTNMANATATISDQWRELKISQRKLYEFKRVTLSRPGPIFASKKKGSDQYHVYVKVGEKFGHII